MEFPAALFLDCSVRRLRQTASRIEDCLGRLSDIQIWARGSQTENAVGNLVLHLCGNVRQWIIAGIGGRPDIRERTVEFAAQGAISAAELAARLRAVVDEAAAVIERLPDGRLTERLTIQQYELTVLEAIYHVVEHFSGHAGQIIYATKMLTGEDLGYYRHLQSAAPHHQQTP
ncbi:MAG TPA: DinB family protein [Bryobacteraceae bacterium]|nr:DinB family protein [Bryobacteraceae bacterium]